MYNQLTSYSNSQRHCTQYLSNLYWPKYCTLAITHTCWLSTAYFHNTTTPLHKLFPPTYSQNSPLPRQSLLTTLNSAASTRHLYENIQWIMQDIGNIYKIKKHFHLSFFKFLTSDTGMIQRCNKFQWGG